MTMKQIHDRMLSGGIGTVIGYVIVQYALGAHAGATVSPEAQALVYGPSVTLGAMLGAAAPEKVRPWIQAVAAVITGALVASSM